jgi:hypothetical protein
MIICIGPFCVPLWGLLPLIMIFVNKMWDRIKLLWFRWCTFSLRRALTWFRFTGVQPTPADARKCDAGVETSPKAGIRL